MAMLGRTTPTDRYGTAFASLDAEQLNGERPAQRLELRCAGCAYRAIARTTPVQCPMCAGASWEFVEWRPFSSSLERRLLRHESTI